MEWLRAILEASPLTALFLTIAAGYFVGEVNLKGFALGSGAVLFVGLACGAFAPKSAPPGLVVLDLCSAPHVDMQSTQVLAGLAKDLAAMGIQFQIVEARSAVRETLRGEGREASVGSINRFTSVADAVERFRESSP